MNPLILIAIIPFLSGVLGYIIDRLRNEFHFIGTILTLYYAVSLFVITRKPVSLEYNFFSINKNNIGFFLDQFSSIIVIAIALISFVILLYSLRSMRGFKQIKIYYLLLLTAISIANCLILSNNLIMLVICSILSLIILYLVIFITSDNRALSTKSLLFLVGLSNFLILAGFMILLLKYDTVSITSDLKLTISNSLPTLSFILILIGIIGKICIIPLRSWTLKQIKSPVTVMTLMPMIIDKLTGIYILFRISYFVFDISQMMPIKAIILAVGGIGIVVSGFLAIKEKEAYRLITFNSILQIGVIFIGISLSNPFALAGSIYHLISYLTFQPALLLSIGSIEYWTKATSLANFHGLSSKMPITFIILLIVVLASTGIPPFNGFFSKWLILDGTLKSSASKLISVISFVFITFANIISPIYFLRLLYAFKGKDTVYSQKIRDPGFTMWSSIALLATLSIISGIFSNSFSLRLIALPSVYKVFPELINISTWTFSPALLILLISLSAGIIIYYLKFNPIKLRSTNG